jgi:hypothetical protein
MGPQSRRKRGQSRIHSNGIGHEVLRSLGYLGTPYPQLIGSGSSHARATRIPEKLFEETGKPVYFEVDDEGYGRIYHSGFKFKKEDSTCTEDLIKAIYGTSEPDIELCRFCSWDELELIIKGKYNA